LLWSYVVQPAIAAATPKSAVRSNLNAQFTFLIDHLPLSEPSSGARRRRFYLTAMAANAHLRASEALYLPRANTYLHMMGQ
jgi:hypothetical protein